MRPFHASALLLALLTPALPLACGGSTAVTATSACTDYAKAYCQQIAQCDSVTMEVEFANNVGECTTVLTPECTATLTLPGTGITPAWVEGCAKATSVGGCSNYGAGKPPSACALPAGTLAPGVACFSETQCTSGNCDFPGSEQEDAGSSCGTCAPLQTSTASCIRDSDCPGDQLCIENPPTGTTPSKTACVSPLAAGGSCGMEGEAPCQSGLVCQFAGDAGTQSSCQPLPGAGQTCSSSPGLVYGCANGFICNGTTCVAPDFVSIGAICAANPAPGATPAVCAGGQCVGGACVAFLAVGSDCTENGSLCTTAASCVNGKCESEESQIVAGCK
jgi:hypothetical protein